VCGTSLAPNLHYRLSEKEYAQADVEKTIIGRVQSKVLLQKRGKGREKGEIFRYVRGAPFPPKSLCRSTPLWMGAEVNVRV